MIDFQYVYCQHFSTIKPIYDEMKARGYDVRKREEWEVNEQAELTITSFNVLVDKNSNYDKYVMHHHGLEPTKGALVKKFYPSGRKREKTCLMHLVASEWYKDKFLERGNRADRVKVVGYPKLDVLINNREGLQAEVENNIVIKHPTLLYAPSSRLLEDTKKESFTRLEKACELLGVQLIVKYHEERINKFRPEMENAIFVSSLENIVPYYTVADILVHDCSSSAYEFAYLDRPIIAIKDALEDKFLTDIGLNIESKDLKGAIERSLENPEEFSDNRKAWVKKSYLTDGKATDRAVKEIETYLHKKGISIDRCK